MNSSKRSVLLILLLAACSDGPKLESEAESELDAAANPASTMKREAGFTPLKPVPDGGYADGEVPDLDVPLEANLQVNGKNLPCGACSVLAVQAQGGRRPYTYQWNDPALQGPGPHRVCPNEPIEYTVTLTDSSAVSGELTVQAKTTEARAQLACVADAGVAPSEFGCLTQSSFDEPDPSAKPVLCEASPDGGMLTDQGFVALNEVSGKVQTPIVPGQQYEYIYDHLLPLVIGQGVTVEVYGAFADQPCVKDDMLFSFRLDGTWHQSVCFTPKKAYTHAITRVSVDGVWFWFDLGQIGTICNGCSN
jgi:hypothetical protein